LVFGALIPVNLTLPINLFIKAKEMKKILLMVCALGFAIMGFAQKQLESLYNVKLGNSLECDICFYSNGKYELEVMNKLAPTVEDVTILSKGNYKVEGNIISLLDSCTGFQILCERKPDKLKIVKGFPFMLQHTFKEYGGTSTFKPKDFQPEFDPKKTQNARNKYKQMHPDKYPLYYSQYINNVYALEIKKENKYVLSFQGLLLAEGIWKRDGNELLLFDKASQHTYYVLIAKEGLIGKYLPGNFNNLILYEKNYPMKDEISMIHYRTHKTPVFEKADIFGYVEEMPQFPHGGEKGLYEFIKKNTRYPEEAKKAGKKGKVYLIATIDEEGFIGKVNIVLGLTPACDQEAVRVIKSMPKWIPGRQNGHNVVVEYLIKVEFGND
jgi:TonB family protein